MGQAKNAVLKCGDKVLDLTIPRVMAILNVTPDSFSDGGLFLSVENALGAAERMVDEGASIIDVGGESTRPGAQPISVQQELDRVIPVVEKITNNLEVVVSVDTSTPEVMAESAKLGVGLINDVRALQRQGALEAVAASGVAVCLMHMQGQPGSMQQDPQYDNVVEEVLNFFNIRIRQCVEAGIDRRGVLVDPGFGFGKSLSHNLKLLQSLSEFKKLKCPVLVGVSRKSMIGAIIDRPVTERVYASVVAAVMAVQQGADIVRVHDVAATMDGLKMVQAMSG